MMSKERINVFLVRNFSQENSSLQEFINTMSSEVPFLTSQFEEKFKPPFFLGDPSFHRSRVCVPLSRRQDLSHQKVNFFDDSNFPSRNHCRSPSFLRDSSFHRSRVCVPLSLRQDLSHQKVNFLDDSNFPSRKHCRSPSFLRHSSFHRNRVCVPLSLRQDLIYQKVNF